MKAVHYIIFLSLFMTACFPEKETSKSSNYAALYNPSEFSINSDFRVYHVTEELSILYIRLFPSELLFNQANEEGEYRAMVQIEHSLYELDERGQLLYKVDSATSLLKLGKNEREKSAYLSSLIIPVPSGKKYMLKLEISDLQRGTNGLAHVFIDKTNKLSSQNFSVVTAGTGLPKFMNYHHLGEVFSIHYREKDIDTIYLDFFKNDYELPRPPIRRIDLSAFPVVRDTTIALPFSDSIIFTLPGEGMYQFRIDTSSEEGLTIFNFGNSYPLIKNEKDMIGPLFYIAYPSEFSDLVSSNGDKIALDEFWLRRSSNMDRSRELIRIYYNRVLYSNIYFTAGREGWKTDRGLIYILFGPPDRMKDSGTSQNWYYISRRRGEIVEFKFNRDQNFYTIDAYTLEKNTYTLRYLDDAIRSWNSGKVHSLRN